MMTGNVIFDGIIALFAAIGVAAVIWLALGLLIRPKECAGICACTVLATKNADANLEEAVHSLIWWRDALPDDRQIVICDCGDGNAEFARVMEAKYDQVVFMPPDQLGEYITKRLEQSSAGDVNGTGTDTAGGNG